MAKQKVIVLPYEEAWPNEFEKIRSELTVALPLIGLRFEHVGSTSVKGLAAKPIIDLDLIMDDGLFEQVKSKLLATGYLHEGDLGIPGREAFKYAEKPHLMKHNLYVCYESSQEWKRHITFRDWLRTHDADRDWYGKTKAEAALLYPEDIYAYILYKTPCILAIYQKCGLVSM